MDTAMQELEAQLSRIVALDLSGIVMDAFRSVKIFLVWNVRPDGAAWYHPSRQWLEDNGRNPEKALSVEIANAVNCVNWSRQNQPWMVLHELIHGYHHQTLGFGHTPTLDAYNNAVNTGIYESVPYNPGHGQPHFNLRAYALTNDIEYLAEISKAFFGENDYYPFFRADLQTHDPQGYALMLDLWQVTGVSVAELPTASPLYPNPTADLLNINTPTGTRNQVYDLLGRALLTTEATAGHTTLDLSPYPAGVYLIRITEGTQIHHRQILRIP